MRAWFIFLMAVLFLLSLGADQGQREEEAWAHMSEEAEKILNLVKEAEYGVAKSRLPAIEKRLTSVNYQEMSLNVHDMGMIIVSFKDLQGALTETSLPHEERVRSGQRFAYVANATSEREEPKWRETEQMIKTKTNELREATKAEEAEVYQKAWNDWLSTFEMIRPAATLRVPVSEREELQALISFMGEHSHRLKEEKEAEPFFRTLDHAINRLYHPDPSRNEGSLLTVILSIGSVLFLSLSYTGWKKYKGEKKRTRDQS